MNNDKPKLYVMEECPGLMVDGYVFDSSFNMLFLSVWGRDTAIQAFIARLTLAESDQGIKEAHILNEAGGSLPVHFGATSRLQKRIARTPRRTLFGALSHLWIYDERLVQLDKANARAVLLLSESTDEHETKRRIWQTVKELCPLPLLDHWETTVIAILVETQMISKLPNSGIGTLSGYTFDLDVPALEKRIGHEIKINDLTEDVATTVIAA